MLASGIADRLVSSTMCSSASSDDGKRARSQKARAMTGTGRSDGGETASSARTGRRKRRGSVSASAAYLSCRRHHLHRHNQSRSQLEQSGIVTKTAQRRRKGGNIRSLAPNALFDPLKFDPNRVSVSFCEDSVLNDSPTSLLKPRRYTLTHNDLTRHLTLSVSKEFNETQMSIWYTKLLRDEVLAEWRSDGLHLFCQVSADGAWWIRWAAPFRAIVFRQKLPLVLDTLRYAERSLFEKHPELLETPVYVNFSSVESARKNREGSDKEYWGVLKHAGGKNELRLKVNENNEDDEGDLSFSSSSSSSSSPSEAATVTAQRDLQTMLELSRARAEKQVLPQYQRKEFELPLNNTSDPVVNEEEKENIASSKSR